MQIFLLFFVKSVLFAQKKSPEGLNFRLRVTGYGLRVTGYLPLIIGIDAGVDRHGVTAAAHAEETGHGDRSNGYFGLCILLSHNVSSLFDGLTLYVVADAILLNDEHAVLYILHALHRIVRLLNAGSAVEDEA